MAFTLRMLCCAFFLLVTLAFAPAVLGQQTRVYVDGENGEDAGTGASWANAYKTIGHAILRSLSSQAMIEEIWIKAGTYKPLTKTATWRFPIGVNVYGGFAGNESSLDQRMPYMHETILSADLAGDDSPSDLTSFDDNMTQEIVRMDIIQPQSPIGSRESLFDLLVFEGAYWDAWMTLSTSLFNCSDTDGPITVTRCIFRKSYPDTVGTILFDVTGSVRLVACEFVDNHQITQIEDCCPASPVALWIAGCPNAESPSVVNCLFANNSLLPIVIGFGSSQFRNIVHNCVFLNNTPLFVGAMDVSGYADVVNCTFVNCYASAPQWAEGWFPEPPYSWGLVRGSGFESADANLNMTNCVVSDSSTIFNMYYFDNGAPGYPPGLVRVIRHSVTSSAVGGGVAGPGMIFGPVEFSSPGGAFFTLSAGSLGIDAGDSTAFHDYIIGPYDYYAAPRYFNIPSVPDTGVPTPNHPSGMIDMGAVERQCDYCTADLNCDAMTNISDFNLLASHFGMTVGATRIDGDVSGDGAVNIADFNILAGDFGCDMN